MRAKTAIMLGWAAVLVWGACAESATNVFEMPLVYAQHRQLQTRLAQSVREGKTDEMEAVCREGVALLPRDPTWQYNLACALAYRADAGPSLDALDRAIEMGFRDARAIAADTDLKRLSSLPRFGELVEKARRLSGKPVEGVAEVKPSAVVMGMPAEVHGSNTVWDFEAGCFRTFFTLIRPELKKVSAYAGAYNGPAKELVGRWMREDAAAGNFGDLYVNRDNGHSALAVSNFPGLTPVVYNKEARDQRVHLSLPNTLFESPVLGNSSMSMVSGPFWRSLPRAVVTDPLQPIAALRYYLSNQCWFYPEHKDYDADTGDLFPANTPYYVVSQGSSYSDQPFLSAFAAALAALRPETKQALIARNALAPTMQMILRATQKSVKKPEDYLTGLAHPAVFDAANLDPEAMVTLAHALTPSTLPPTVMLRTTEDAKAEPGIDFFDVRPEGLFDTPFAIARVVRGVARDRRMTIEASAVPALEPDGRYLWVVLQGDPKKITIRPLTPNASRVELTVSYHGVFRPIDPDGMPAKLMSGRVDIGCFVKVGPYYSPPSFVSFYYLPNETRAYRDDGQILSIDYTNPQHRYADPALTLQKSWKDLYEYDDRGRLLGWYRTRGGGQSERFTYLGHRVLSTDKQNRPVSACAVQYMPRQTGGDQLPPALTCADTALTFRYTYAGDDDKVGTAVAVGK